MNNPIWGVMSVFILALSEPVKPNRNLPYEVESYTQNDHYWISVPDPFDIFPITIVTKEWD